MHSALSVVIQTENSSYIFTAAISELWLNKRHHRWEENKFCSQVFLSTVLICFVSLNNLIHYHLQVGIFGVEARGQTYVQNHHPDVFGSQSPARQKQTVS